MKRKVKVFAIMAAVLLSLFQVPAIDSSAANTSGIDFVCGKNASMAHVQTYGDTAGTVSNVEGFQTLNLGTTGQSKRLEAIRIQIDNNTGYTGDITYQVHVQTLGWMYWAGNGERNGTKGLGKRLEGIRIKLTGELAKHYDVRYRVHIQTYGDSQGWVYNGALAGTTGEAKRLERLQVQIIPKSTISGEPSVSYRVHRQTYGWESFGKANGQVSGTTGQSKRLEGIQISLSGGNAYSGNILYRTHIQTYGWEKNWKQDGEMSGTSGQAKRLEAIQIKLSGEISDFYDIYYRVHAQSYGWLGWAKNGETAGTEGLAKRLEAIQIVLVKKGGSAPGNCKGIYSTTNSSYIKGASIAECPTSSTGRHNWQEAYTTVTDREAYNEKVPTGEFNTTLEKHKYSHAFSNEGWNDKFLYTVDITGWTSEQRRQYERDNNLNSYCLDAFWTDYIKVPDYNNPIYEYVHHDAVTHKELTGYTCSCGETKEAATVCNHTYEPVYKTVIDSAEYDEITWVDDFPNAHTRRICTTEATHVTNNASNTGWYSDNYTIDITGWTDAQKRAYEQSKKLPSGMLDRERYQYQYGYAGCENVVTSRKYTTVHHDKVTHQELDYYRCSKCGQTKSK